MFSNYYKHNTKQAHGTARGLMLCAKHDAGTTTRTFIVAWCQKLP